MGYYTGSGVVTGGGQSYNVLRTFAALGQTCFKIWQKNVYSTTKKSGVSLATAQDVDESHSMDCLTGGSGAYTWVVFDASGTRSTPTYSRIGDSNLYELNVLNETLTADKEAEIP